jgi:peptidoglycan LD-endopeptidase CwlK
MPAFSRRSLRELSTCDPRLRQLFRRIVEHWDCTILEGYRDHERQAQMVAEGKSQLAWPKSKHNSSPSQAVDVVPYPIDWQDRERMRRFACFVLGYAAATHLRIRWCGDWDGDHRIDDQGFDDLPHFELE